MTSPTDLRDPVDDELGKPCPRAFAYFYLATGYEHAEEQWRQQITKLAREEGYVIERWFGDSGDHSDSLVAMLTQLPWYQVSAIFVPDISHLVRMHRFGGEYAEAKGKTKGELIKLLQRQIFVLTDGVAVILPPHRWKAEQARRAQHEVLQPPPRRWRPWSRRR